MAMKYKNIMDMHVHTDNSFDGYHSTMYMCESACESGIRAVAFTDHVESDCLYDQHYDKTALQSFFEATKARSVFNGKMIVCAGIELGEAHYVPENSDKLFEMYKYDFVLGSIHNLRNMPDFSQLDYSQFDVDALLTEYFNEIYSLAQWGKIDSLAHLTYPIRYISGVQKIKVDLEKYGKRIDEALSLLAEKDIALEINTSGLRQKLRKTMPDEDVVLRFRQLGGKLITIGSDAHKAEDIGRGVRKAMDIAKRCGFDSMALFQQRQPIEVPIE